jgi:hypothetical protein
VTLSESDDNSLLGAFGTGPGGPALDVPNYIQGHLGLNDPRSGKPYISTLRSSLPKLWDSWETRSIVLSRGPALTTSTSRC